MISDADLEALSATVHGPVSRPGDAAYERDTATYNLSLIHAPDAVLGAAHAGDVQNAVRWAARRDIPLAVQATGHAVSAAMDEGLLINTSRLQDVVVDPDAGTATVGAGVRWSSVLEASVPLGLTAAHGSSGQVGAVGYTSGGGLALMGRALGYGSDHVQSLTVITPDGQLHLVEPAGEDAELFTVLRGGKGNFGVITSMTFALTPFQEFYGGGLMYPDRTAPDVLSAFLEWTAQLPSDASASLAFLHLPDAPFLPPELRGTSPVHLRFGLFGSAEEGDTLLEPMRRAAPAFIDTAGPMDYRGVGGIHQDPDEPMPGMERGALLSDLPQDAADELLRQVGPDSGSTLLMTEIRLMGGALAVAPEAEDAVSGRDAAFHLFLIGLNAPPFAESTAAALDSLSDAVAPYATGSLINFHGPAGDERNRERAWTPEVYQRLRTAKGRYDPQNLFRFGHAVPLPVG